MFCNWPCNSILSCNSLYLYVMNVNEQVTWNAKLQLTIYMVQFIVVPLQLSQNNSFSTIIQLHYNYTHDVMLMSIIIIHLLKFNTWHYEDFLTLKKFNIDFHRLLWFLMTIRNCDTWHNRKLPHGILILFWKI